MKNFVTVATCISAFVTAFCVCCLDTDPYPAWLFPVLCVAGVLTAVGIYLLKDWYLDEDDEDGALWKAWQ